MEYRNLGRSGLKVSPLCLGTMMFGEWGNQDHDASIRIIHRALDEGINFVDTANVYSAGESEEIVGKAIRDRRDDVVLATKVWGPMGDGPHRKGLSRKTIQQEVEASLRRLGTDVIDLYQIHRPDFDTPWEETLSALTDLVRQGKVRHIGCSTSHDTDPSGEQMWRREFEAWRIVETLWLAEKKGFERFISIQPPYSILRRKMELEHFPMSQRHGLGNIVWSPLEGGFLTGKYRLDGDLPDTPRAKSFVKDLDRPELRPRLEIVEELLPMAEAKGVPLAQFSLAWALRHPAVTSVIIGPRTMEQLEGCLASLDVEITDEDAQKIDELVPPGTVAL